MSNLLLSLAASGIIRNAHHVRRPDGVVERALLLERASTQSCFNTEDLTNAGWAKTRTTISANAETAPDGTLTADRVIEDSTAANTHLVGRGAGTITADGIVGGSWFVKRGVGRDWCRLHVTGPGGGDSFSAYFNLATGAEGQSNNFGVGVFLGSKMEPLEDTGWYRLMVWGRVMGGHTTAGISLYLAEADGDVTFDGDGASYLVAWGAQVEDATAPSSYIPNTASPPTTVTRNADSLYLPWNIAAATMQAQGLSLYGKLVVRRVGEINGALVIGSSSLGANDCVALFISATGVTARINSSASGSPQQHSSARTVTLAVGDVLEYLLTGTPGAAPVVQLTTSLNGESPVVSTASSPGTWPAAYSFPRIYFADAATASQMGDVARLAVAATLGVNTMELMRRLAGVR